MRTNQDGYKHNKLWNKGRTAVLLTLLLMTLCCLGTAAYLRAKSGSNMYAFLVWDMFLAWVPLLISSLIVYVLECKGFKPGWLGAALVGLLCLIWLFFLPNAAYLYTEMLHAFRYFTAQPESPFWYNMDFWYSLTLSLGTAIVGLLLSTCSVRQIENVLYLFVHKYVCWIIISFILLLSSLGVYIGRYNRWNSWDVVSRPEQIITDLLHDFGAVDSMLLEFVILMSVVQGFVYIIVSLMSSRTNQRQH
ncbi:DUF1361 domain-containing protein [Paenibacillus sp. AN1007]|uniref:DUF1361 domain-containing protein n=1 Tax=Paenibacillus sp. AN1007 TaxID=3151385 RepID=A0AAU8NDJ1_9BACL